MRTLVTSVVLVGLLVLPTLGEPTINVRLLANGSSNLTVLTGTPITVAGQFECTAGGAGVCAVGGDVIKATGVSIPNFTYSPLSSFYASDFLAGGSSLPPATPVAGVNGSLCHIGSCQSITLQNPSWNTSFANGVYKTLFSYTITPTSAGTVTLQWYDVDPSTGGYSGWLTLDTAGDNGINVNDSVVITVTPEPATLSLLALGGLLIARRRRV